MNKTTPTCANVVVLKQMLNLIPRGMINRHALDTGVEAKAHTFSVVSHLSAMLFAQLSHAIGLNDVCDWLRLKSGVLARFGAPPPSRNDLSNANKDRSAEFAEKLFWSVLGHLQHASPEFAAGRKGKGLLRRFKVRSIKITHRTNSRIIGTESYSDHSGGIYDQWGLLTIPDLVSEMQSEIGRSHSR